MKPPTPPIRNPRRKSAKKPAVNKSYWTPERRQAARLKALVQHALHRNPEQALIPF